MGRLRWVSFSVALYCVFFGTWTHAEMVAGKRVLNGAATTPVSMPVELPKPVAAPQNSLKPIVLPVMPAGGKPIPNPGTVKVTPFVVIGTGNVAPSQPPVPSSRVVNVAPFSVIGAGYVAPKSNAPVPRVVNVPPFQVFGTH